MFVIVSVLPDALNVVLDEFMLMRSPAAAPEPLFERTDTTKSVLEFAANVLLVSNNQLSTRSRVNYKLSTNCNCSDRCITITIVFSVLI